MKKIILCFITILISANLSATESAENRFIKSFQTSLMKNHEKLRACLNKVKQLPKGATEVKFVVEAKDKVINRTGVFLVDYPIQVRSCIISVLHSIKLLEATPNGHIYKLEIPLILKN